jgi:hypothetical protein
LGVSISTKPIDSVCVKFHRALTIASSSGLIDIDVPSLNPFYKDIALVVGFCDYLYI